MENKVVQCREELVSELKVMKSQGKQKAAQHSALVCMPGQFAKDLDEKSKEVRFQMAMHVAKGYRQKRIMEKLRVDGGPSQT